MQKYTKWITLVIALCFSLILGLMTMDWLTKYVLYLDQRNALYSIIKSGVTEVDQHKQIVAYLQGTASRRLNDVMDVTVRFGIVFFVYYLYAKNLNRSDCK